MQNGNENPDICMVFRVSRIAQSRWIER